ncbi:MAG: AAA family ATPase [Leadbetterella sp.]|nr:AAA family ATPase [Leadbetterella sp.]
MKIELAKREQAKIKIGLQGPSGSGKSFSALLLAHGLTNDWTKIVVIDTENKSSSLYSHLGDFNILDLKPPYSPERYIEAINLCVKYGMQAIIIDSISMEWEYILDAHSQLTGNSYTNWARFTPRHQKFIQAILHADIHIICTLRSKQDYVLTENEKGKLAPEKVGMKAIQRDGTDYELTLMFELDIKHNAVTTKDRTGLFSGRLPFQITQDTGKEILNWCQTGEIVVRDYENLIKGCNSLQELLSLFESVSKEVQQQFNSDFTQRKLQLTPNYASNGIS